MTMEYRHAFDNGVGEIQDYINRTAIRNIHSIQPCRVCECDAVFCVGKEVNLVNVERMQFASLVDNAPMLISAHANGCHWTSIWRLLLPVDIEAVLVFGEGDKKFRRTLLQRFDVDKLVKRWAIVNRVLLFRA